MKSGKPKKAPKVRAPSRKKPNYMREADQIKGNSGNVMKKKRLSK